MREHWYEPGDEQSWLTLATGDQLLAVGPRSDLALDELWAALASGFQAVLDALTSRGLSATPSFALLSWSGDGLRAIVRGPARLVVDGEDAGHVLDGTGVSTWTERMFAADSAFELSLGSTASGARVLPLVSGAALAARVASTARPSTTPAPSSSTAASTPVAVTPEVEVPTPAGGVPVPEATIRDVSDHEPAEPEPAGSEPAERESADPEWIESGAAESGPAASAELPDEALLGETVHRVPTPVEAGDHDGMTIMTGDLRRMRGERKAKAPVAAAVPPSPVLSLQLSSGATEPLDRTLIVGRAPSASKVSGGDLPRLITIPGDKDISRNHAQFAVEGGTVVVTDLHSRNGTQVIMPGRAPQQLRQGEPTAVIVGTTVDLGGGVTLTVREGD